MNVNEIADWLIVRHRYDQEDRNSTVLNRIKLMNLLYYVQGVSLGMYQRRAFDDPIVVQPDGVKIKAVDEHLNDDHNLDTKLSYTEIKRYSNVQENPELHHALNVVDKAYGDDLPFDLSQRVRSELPWRRTDLNHEIAPQLLRTNFDAKLIE